MIRFTLALATVLASAALARADDMGSMAMGAQSPADRAFMQSMATMHDAMAVKPSGNTDRDFARMMLPHHQGAIDMAKVELRYGKDPAMRKLAGDIVKAQEDEIALMRDWLAQGRR